MLGEVFYNLRAVKVLFNFDMKLRSHKTPNWQIQLHKKFLKHDPKSEKQKIVSSGKQKQTKNNRKSKLLAINSLDPSNGQIFPI